MMMETTDSLVEQRLEGAYARMIGLFGGQGFWLAWPSSDAVETGLATIAA
jgi:hypothetical protein